VNINIIAGSAWNTASAGLKACLNAVIAEFDQLYSDPITINLKVDIGKGSQHNNRGHAPGQG